MAVPKIYGAPLNWATKGYGYLKVTADMSSATWNTAATHELFTVTGLVRMKILAECTETLVDAADLAVIQLGTESATNAFIAATNAAGKGGVTIEENELWVDNSPDAAYDTFANAVLDRVVNGEDVGYEITGAALTNGTMVFHCWWESISAGNVEAGTGAAMV